MYACKCVRIRVYVYICCGKYSALYINKTNKSRIPNFIHNTRKVYRQHFQVKIEKLIEGSTETNI